MILEEKQAVVNADGSAVIPDGTEVIGRNAFCFNKELRHVALPPSVRKIEPWAFAHCRSLETLILNDGLETVDDYAFAHCSSLTELVIPDSVTSLHGGAFDGLRLKQPVFSAAGDVLYHYPVFGADKVYTVPESVRRIGHLAFRQNIRLQEVILPEGLEEIGLLAFSNARALRRVTVPASVNRVGAGTFMNCERLEEICFLCKPSAVSDRAVFQSPKAKVIFPGREISFEAELRIRGITDPITVPRGLDIPKDAIRKDRPYLALARRCAAGDTEAMLSLAADYEARGDDLFYTCAANFWRYRAFLLGNRRAEDWKNRWMDKHPRQLIPCAMPAKLEGSFSGDLLRALGFLLFEPGRTYSISRPDENGIVEVDSWCGEDGPDEDGFGREDYYDWWYLDKNLSELPGVPMIHSYSTRDKQVFPERFEKAYAAAQKAMDKRKSEGLSPFY